MKTRLHCAADSTEFILTWPEKGQAQITYLGVPLVVTDQLALLNADKEKVSQSGGSEIFSAPLLSSYAWGKGSIRVEEDAPGTYSRSLNVRNPEFPSGPECTIELILKPQKGTGYYKDETVYDVPFDDR